MPLAQMQWTGLVNVPNGLGGVYLGVTGIATRNLFINDVAASTPFYGSEGNRYARISQDSLYNQILLANADLSIGLPSIHQWASSLWAGIISDSRTYEFSINSEPSPTTNAHAVQAELEPVLPARQEILTEAESSIERSVESDIGEDRAFVYDTSIKVSNFDISSHTAIPSSNGTVSDSEILNLQELSLLMLDFQSSLISERSHSIGIEPLSPLGITADLSQQQYQENQRALQQSFSFGSLTLLSDRKWVKRSDLSSPLLLALFSPHVSRLTPNPSRLTFHLSRFTFHASRFDTPQAICYAPRRFRACYDKRDLSP